MSLKDSPIGDVLEGAEEAAKSALVRAAQANERVSRTSHLLDRLQEKVISRKLLVFVTATALMWYGLDAETWGLIAMCYIGGQSAIDFAKMWRHGA